MRIPLPVSRSVRGLAISALVVSIVANGPVGSQQALADPVPSFDLALNTALLNALPELVLDPTTDPPGKFKSVKPREFDPAKTSLVQAAWLHGLGCPTQASTLVFNPDGSTSPGTFADTACPSGDANDYKIEGLLLVKTGPTNNFASATAELTNVKGMTLTELGYDIRKSGLTSASPLGSHCGGGAPRFNVVDSLGTTHFLACNSPVAPGQTPSLTGWIRLRWDAAGLAAAFPPITPTTVVQRIVIIFDEAQDASGAPDQFGAAILDNIDVNGMLVGRGGTNAG